MNIARSKALIEIAIFINRSMSDYEAGSESYETLEALMEQLTMMANDDDVELRNCILLAIAEEHSGDGEEGNRIADSVFNAIKDLIT